MTHYLRQELVDINLFPGRVDLTVDAGHHITFGDMHGNALKFLFGLIFYGFFKMSEQDYDQFKTLYYKEILNREDLEHLDQIFERIDIRSDAQKLYLRLLGDTLADRGSNDLFTLKIYKKLHENHISFEVLLSNHDADFIQNYEKKSRFDKGFIASSCRRSAVNLQNLIDRNFVRREDIDYLIETVYKPHMKLIGYSLNNKTGEITLFSHALNGEQTIGAMAFYLDVNPSLDISTYTEQDLPDMIDKINEKFRINHVFKSEVTALIDLESIDRGAFNTGTKKGISIINFPFAHLIWNRLDDVELWPQVLHVHGHDSGGMPLEHVIKLDNTLGKTPALNKQTFLALHSVGEQLSKRLTFDIENAENKYKP